MKLLLCPKCYDIVKLQFSTRSCQCGASSGKYLPDGLLAVVSPDAMVIGIDNHMMKRAVMARRSPDSGHRTLAAWLMAEDAPNVRRKDA